MELCLNLMPTDARVGVVNLIILIILVVGIYDGYKKGFLESGVRFVGTIFAIVGAYIIKNPLSVFLYKYLPFFKFSGFLKGVSVVNILVYEFIAFLIVFVVLSVIVKIVLDITNIIDNLLSLILFIGLPNKILGALLGVLQTIVLLYFLACGFKITMNIKGIDVQPSLADDLLKVPVLEGTFGDAFDALDEIAGIAKNYESINAKEEYNYESLKILIKYNIVTKQNAKYLIDNSKVRIPDDKDYDTLLKDLEVAKGNSNDKNEEKKEEVKEETKEE